MTYLPFCKIERGQLFKNSNSQVFMKLTDDTAVSMTSVWISKTSLSRRGSVVTLYQDYCVRPLEATEEFTLSASPQTPENPFKTYWKQGETREVGDALRNSINLFAGLYLYSGLGSGHYFSKTGEVIFGDAESAKEIAAREKIPFVFYDSMDWTSDPTLARQRERAMLSFEDTEPQDCTQAA